MKSVEECQRPVCQMQYLRRAYFGVESGTPVRLTFDRQIQGRRENEWRLDTPEEMLPLLQGQVICEMKFEDSMPTAFKNAIEQFQITPQGCSKYRRCIRNTDTENLLGVESA
ncbi:VTC domain-containing protein [Planctomicrobium sp. SH668]|uniref:VTC domain-containing protein n=1 Tax=Planctomicrobium sp. SH668 TaxID=3448126 RepID=UPI003F5BE9C3